MIDLHLHLLPGVDDGAATPGEASAMLASFHALGFDRLVVTPHLMEPLTDDYHQQIIDAMNVVSPSAANVGIGLGLGYEHMLHSRLVDRLEAGEPTTMAGSRAVLVELPFMAWPSDTAHSLYTLRSADYRPILAHPERYLDALANPKLVLDSAEHGAVLQVTTGSLVGLYGKESMGLARLILRAALHRGYLVVLGSDAHSNGQRLQAVGSGLDWIRANVPAGEQLVEWSAIQMPNWLLADAEPLDFRTWISFAYPTVDLPDPEALSLEVEPPVEKKGLLETFGRFFRGQS